MVKKVIISFLFPAMLVGCAGPEITTQDVELEKARIKVSEQQAVEKIKADQAEYEALSKMAPEQVGMAYMGKQMKEMMVAVLEQGKKVPMGFYDMKTSIAQSQNAMVDKTIGRVVTLTTAGTAMFVAGDVIKHGQDKIGDRINAGEGSTVEVNRISSKSKTDTNQLGDNNSTGAVDASTTGPDKSSVVVNNELAPEEPVVEEGEFEPTEPPAEFDDLPIDIPEVPAEEGE